MDWFYAFPTEQPGPDFLKAFWKAGCEHGQLEAEKCEMSDCEAGHYRADFGETNPKSPEGALKLRKFSAECI